MGDNDDRMMCVTLEASKDGRDEMRLDEAINPRLHRLPRLGFDPVDGPCCDLSRLCPGTVSLSFVRAKTPLPDLSKLYDRRHVTDTSSDRLCLSDSLGSLDSSLEVRGKDVMD